MSDIWAVNDPSTALLGIAPPNQNQPNGNTPGPYTADPAANARQFINNWAQRLPALSSTPGVDPNSVQQLYNYDLSRIQSGKTPLSHVQVAQGLLTLNNPDPNNPVVKPPHQGGLGGLISIPVDDIRGILSGLPKIPSAIFNEGARLGETPGDVAQGFADVSRNPGKGIAEIAQAPGIRMIPGAFTVGSIASGHPGELAQHPISTLLDVLPAAEELGIPGKIAELAPIVKAREGLNQFLSERAFGGTQARDWAKTASQAQRIGSERGYDVATATNEAFKNLQVPEDMHAPIMDWMQTQRGQVPPPTPLHSAVDELVQATNQKMEGLYGQTGRQDGLFYHAQNGETYLVNSPEGRRFINMDKLIDRNNERMTRTAAQVAWAESRLNTDSARFAAMSSGLPNPEGVADTLGQHADTVRQAYEGDLGTLGARQPPAPGQTLSFHSGEQAWADNQRVAGRNPEMIQEIVSGRSRGTPNEENRVTVNEQTGRATSGKFDEIQRQQAENEAARQAITERRLQITRDIGRIDDAVPPEFRGQQLYTQWQAAHNFLNQADVPDAELSRARAALANPDADEAMRSAAQDVLNRQEHITNNKASSQEYIRKATPVIKARMALERENAALVGARDPFIDEKYALAREGQPAYTTEHPLTAERSYADLLQRKNELARASRDEETRLADYESGGKKPHLIERQIEGLDPREKSLAKLYEVDHAYEMGSLPDLDKRMATDPSNELLNLPPRTGIQAIRDQIRSLEAEGVSAPAPKEKLLAMRRQGQTVGEYSKDPDVIRFRKLAEARTGYEDAIAKATRALAERDREGIIESTKLARGYVARMDKLTGGENPIYRQEYDNLKEIQNGGKRLGSAQNKLDAAQKRIEASQNRLAERQGKLAAQSEGMAKLQGQYASTAERMPPTRFKPAVHQLAQQMIEKKLREAGYDPIANPDAANHVASEIYSDYLSPDDVNTIYRTADRQWQVMKDEGLDPTYIHHVPTSKARELDRFNMSIDKEVTPGQVKGRATDETPYIHNIQVALTHQALEWVSKDAAENWLYGWKETLASGTVIDHPGILLSLDKGGSAWTETEINTRYLPEIQALAEKRGISQAEAFNAYVRRHFTAFDPDAFFPWRRVVRTTESGRTELLTRVNGDTVEVPTQVYLPKGLAKMMDQMGPTTTRPFVTAAYNKSLRVFRIAHLGLSPGYQVHSLVSGLLLLLGDTGPSALLKLKEAYGMVGRPFSEEMGRGMPNELGRGGQILGDSYTELPRQLVSEPKAMQQFAWGQRMGDMLKKIGGFADKSFKLHEFVANMYRSMAYLYGEDKALTAGMTDVEAHAAGIKIATGILQDWDAKMPWERTVLRGIMPFYGFTQAMIRYALRYPFDHPFRAAVMSSLVRNEVLDRADGLPDRFAQIWWIGDPDSKGNQSTINLSTLNPLGRVGDSLTLAGALSSLSPIFQAGLQVLGVDTQTGRGNLYPDMTYDPTTGRLQAQTTSPLSALADAFIPQSGVVTQALGLNHQMRQLAYTDPGAWRSAVASSFGVSLFVPRERNQQIEMVKAEAARNQAATLALNKAVKTGDWSDADRYTNVVYDLQDGNGPQLISIAAYKQAILNAERAQQPALSGH